MKSDKPKTIRIKNYRIKIGDSHAALNFKFHEDGVMVPCDNIKMATVFTNIATAKAAINRTLNARSDAKKSMYADSAMFAPLMHREAPKLEEFLTEVDTEEES